MLVIFDWDGTLCDSTGRIVEAMQQAAGDESADIPSVDAVRDVIGLGLPEAMATLFPALSSSRRSQVELHYRACYLALDQTPSPLYPGARETLNELREAGCLLAVATGKGRAGLDRLLAGHDLADFFDATRCADETRSKPDPLMVHELLEHLQRGPEDSVVVGDSEYDLMMARAAGVRSVGVSFGVHSAERLERHGPVAVIDELTELSSILMNGA